MLLKFDSFQMELLQVEDDEHFVRLTFDLNEEDEEDKIKIKQNKALLGTLDTFHVEVCYNGIQLWNSILKCMSGD